MKKLLFCCCLGMLLSCAEFEDIVSPDNSTIASNTIPEEGYVFKTPPVSVIELASGDTAHETEDGYFVIQGDILLSREQVEEINSPSTRGAILSGANYMWPNGIVYWDYDPSLPLNYIPSVTSAMLHWEEKTKIKFTKRTNQKDYVVFCHDEKDGSHSPLGRRGGRQDIYINSSDVRGTTIHEIGHSIGLIHEQCRSDRDNYIIVNEANLKPEMKHNFDKSTLSHYVAGDFDFGSVMLYGSYITDTTMVYNINIPTLTKKDGSDWSRQRNGLSELDISAVGKIYGYQGEIVGPSECEAGKEYTFEFDGDILQEYNWFGEGFIITGGQGKNKITAQITGVNNAGVYYAYIYLKKPGSSSSLASKVVKVYSSGILPTGFIEIKNGTTMTFTWNGPTQYANANNWSITPSSSEGGAATNVTKTATTLKAKFSSTKTTSSGSFSIRYIYNGQSYFQSIYIEPLPSRPDPGNPGDPGPPVTPPITTE